jgi:hypothetical protein
VSGVRLTVKEGKLLALMLNRASECGEIHNAALKFVQSLRERGIEVQAVEQALTSEVLPVKHLRPDYGLTRMPWGKRKGLPFCEIPPHELRSALRWAKSTPSVARRFTDFIHDAEAFLNLE